MWSAEDGNGVNGQVSVTQVSVDEEEGSAELQISVFLTAAIRSGNLLACNSGLVGWYLIVMDGYVVVDEISREIKEDGS